MHLTAVFQKVPEGHIGFVEELPGAGTQGATIDEARVNLAVYHRSVRPNTPRVAAYGTNQIDQFGSGSYQ